MSNSVVLCPFWRESRSFTRRLCDNLRDGVPLCVVSGLADELGDWDEEFEQSLMKMSCAEARKAQEARIHSRPRCPSVVRSDLYDAVRPDFKKSGCFFGGLCIRPVSHGFDGCSVDCSRWKR
jgi:hypothetical protein